MKKMENNQNLLNNDLQIDHVSQSHLAETAKWANFLSIVGFVLSGIIAIMALFSGAFLGAAGGRRYGGDSVLIGAGFIMVIYIIIAVLYFFMSLFLFRFASKMKAALYNTDQESLNASFMNLKVLYRFMGIITIIYLVFIVLALVLGIAGTLISS
jgi:uncharacterized membrane protein